MTNFLADPSLYRLIEVSPRGGSYPRTGHSAGTFARAWQGKSNVSGTNPVDTTERDEYGINIIPSTTVELQNQLRAKLPAILLRARELEQDIPDPVQAMINLLGNLPGDYETWREIIDDRP